MIKKYCDICKKETDSVEEYFLPNKEQFWTMGKFNQSIQFVYIYKARKKDLCPTCAAHLYDLIENYLSIANSKNSKLDVKVVLVPKTENDTLKQ